MNKDLRNINIITIDGFKLGKSGFDDVEIVQYIQAEKHPKNKIVAIVDYKIRKMIVADTKEEISKLINDYLESKGEQ